VRLPYPAQYLLRFDDLCPTMPQKPWQRFLPLIEEFYLRPILAVVPANADPELAASGMDSGPNPEFWSAMRQLQHAGAEIGLHGYRHLCESNGRTLVGAVRRSEFAGVPETMQRTWIRAGLDILRSHRLNPRIFVAPRHGFDTRTLCALRAEGIKILSDGFARVPFRRGGLIWIPQQLWAPRERSSGFWTICVHPATASDGEVEELGEFIRRHPVQFTTVDRVLEEFPLRQLSIGERLYATNALWRRRISTIRKRMQRAQ
jgi:predicted deacetylase